MDAFCVRSIVKMLENAIFDPKLDESNNASVFDNWAQNFKKCNVFNILKKDYDDGF